MTVCHSSNSAQGLTPCVFILSKGDTKMEWLDLVIEYEEKHGSFANASYDNPDYVEFRVKMIMLETGLDIYGAVTELARQVANPGGKHISRNKAYKLQRKYEKEFSDVLHIIRR